MAPQLGKNVPKNKVRKIKSKSKELKKKQMKCKSKEYKKMQIEKIKKKAEKMKKSKQVPLLLKRLDKTYMKNLKDWLSNFSSAALTGMQCKGVDFGMVLAKIGLLEETFIEVMQNWLGELAQKCDANTVPTEKPHKKIQLILDNKILQLKSWLDLLHFLLQPLATYENMCVSDVERALELLDLGFARSVHPTIKQKHKIPDGDLCEDIRNKLRQQKALAEKKNAERADKKQQDQKILKEYRNFGDKMTWEEHSRPVAHTGLIVSLDPQKILGPFSMSTQVLEDFLNDARKEAIGTSQTWFHILVLRVYTGPYYAKLNKVLRSHGNEPELKKYAHFLVHLTNALSVLEKLPKDQRTVHRGTALFELNIQPGDKLVFQAPTSASKSMHVANSFMKSQGIHFVIKALTAAGIENFSSYPHEREVLFPPNSHFEVKTITRDKGEMAKVLLSLTADHIQRIDTMVVLEQYA